MRRFDSTSRVGGRAGVRWGLGACLLGATALGTGCYHGRDDMAGLAEGDTEGEGEDEGEAAALCGAENANVPGHRTLRRMTRDEFDASIRDVFALDDAAWSGPLLNADPSVEGFNNNAARLIVDDTYAENLYRTAETVGDAVADPARLSALLPCASAADRACAEQFIDTFGRRLFRRALDDAERDRYLSLFDQISAEEGFERAVRWITVGMVQSPNFVYRSEIGVEGDDGLYELEQHEIATALAYTYTGSSPGEALLQKAEAGQLDSPDAIEAAARALVIDGNGQVSPQFQARFFSFANQWLSLAKLPNLEKDPTAYPDFTQPVREAMQKETEHFLASVVFEERGTTADMLTASHTYVNGTLAAYYGYGDATGDAFVEVERPPEYGIGLLSQGSLMAVTAHNRSTSPTMRGLEVREKFMCFTPPPPPPGIAEIPEPNPDMTTRERYEGHTSNSGCAGCHKYMDAIGFGFEHLDGDGRYRATEGPYQIDDTGKINLLAGESMDFEGPTELALQLAELEETSLCVGQQMAAFAYGVDTQEAECMVDDVAARLASGELSLLDYYLALSTAPHFLRRQR